MVLNEQAVKSAKPGILWDSTLRGFGLRTGKNFKTFIVLVASGRRKKIGRYPLVSLAEARTKAKAMLAEKTLGKVTPTHTAFEEAKKQFLEDCKTRLAESTVTEYEWNLDKLDFGRRSIADVTGAEMLKVLRGQTPSNKEHLYRVARTFFTWCYKAHLIDRSPMERLEKPPTGKSRDRSLTEEELRKVYREASKLETSAQRFVWLILRTACRPGETKGLKRSYFSADRVQLPKEATKNGHPHLFPISKETYKGLDSFPIFDGSDYLFPSPRTHVRGKPVYHLQNNNRLLVEMQDATGTANWTHHDCRRTVSTYWAEKFQVPPHLIERMLNHVSGEVSGVAAVYNRATYLEELRDCVKRWEVYLKKL